MLGRGSLFSHIDIQFLQYHIWKTPIFLHWILLVSVQKLIITNASTVFTYCNFTLSFEIRLCKFSNFVLLQDCLGIFPLHFHVNFRISLPISVFKKSIWILIWIALNIYINLRTVDILKISCLPIHKHCVSLRLLRSFFISLWSILWFNVDVFHISWYIYS